MKAARAILANPPKAACTALQDVTLAAPIRPSTILCSGSNYKDHNAEKANTPISGKEPEFFVKTADCVVGPDEPIAFDERFSKKIDCEVELAIVIGKAGRFIPAARALDHVFGYTIVNDVTARDRQVRRTPEGMTWYELGSGKAFDSGAPLGPCIVTADEIADPQNLKVHVARQRRAAAVEQHVEHDLELRRAHPLLLAQLHAQARHGHHHRHAGRHRLVGRQGAGRQGRALSRAWCRRRATACRATWSNARSRGSACCAIRWRRPAKPRGAHRRRIIEITCQRGTVHGSPPNSCQGALAAPFVAAFRAGQRAPQAQAQAWPTRNITMIVPFPPGGQADLAARPVAAALEKILGRSVVVDNRSGAGGMLGNAAAARAEPDGHTLLMALSSMTFLPEAERLYDRKPSYEFDQLIPIARVLADPGVLCVRSDSPWKTVADLVADAKKRPGQISFSSSGNYGAAHVPFEMFQQAAGIKLLHVPYRGGGPALTAFLGKQVDITAQAPGPITPHVQSGAARLLANWGPKRAAEYPNVPTMIELGYKDVEYYIWAGLFAPKGTPAPVDHAAARRHARGDDEPAGDRRVRQGRQPAGLHGSAGIPEVRRGRRQAAHPGRQKIGRLDEK